MNSLSCSHPISVLLETGDFMLRKWSSSVVYLPMTHLYGHLLLGFNFTIGATTVLMPRFEIERYLRLNQQYKVQCRNPSSDTEDTL
jgi:hypothetical protein